MTHDAAVRTVVKLVPDIEKRGAEKVLREYAVNEDLPPAQLEKLAQVFNTLRTVSHIDKASDRGSSIDLVDVPSLVVGYALDVGHVKKALSPSSNQSHVPSQVDLMSAMRNEVAGPKPVRAMAKAAAAAPKQISTEDMQDAAAEISAEARLEMSKLAGVILGGVPFSDGYYDLSGIERDAIHVLGPACVKCACDWLDQSVKLSRKQSVRYDYTQLLVKQAFAVGSSLSAALVQLAEAVSTFNLMEKLAAKTRISAFDEDEADTAPYAVPHADDLASQYEGMSPEQREAVENYMRSKDMELMPETEEAPYVGDEPTYQHTAESKRTDYPAASSNAGRSPKSPLKTSTDNKRDHEPNRGGGGVGKAWGMATAPIRAVNDVAITASGKVNDLLNSITSKERTNKSQRSTDVSVEDVRRAINVRRMIGTDAVLKEADPREVLEIYNSVARLNPEIAHNMPAMKLLLREAVSYEGLTLDAQKQLTDIRKGTGESEAKEYDNDKRRYTAGGALPIGGQSRKA
jgi:hypothetical protein